MTFPEDHPVVALRGKQRMRPDKVRLILLGRSRWLQSKIDERSRMNLNSSWAVEELAAMEQVLETLESKGE